MLGIDTCRISAILTRALNNATLNIVQLEENQAICPLEARERFFAAQEAWVDHKMSCPFCYGHQLGRVH
jgi:hypothetical protein